LQKKIIHQLSLSDVGGVQRSFSLYFLYSLKKNYFHHRIYSMHNLISNFSILEKHYKNINKSLINKIKFIFFIFSKNYIVHFYNNLGSRSINKLLNIIPSTNIIFHERGAAWNGKDEDIKIYKSNAANAKVILANSNASKIMLNKRFGINKSKIKVIYNGFLNQNRNYIPKNTKRYSKKFSVGYAGRLDTPKGVHVLIEVAKKLKKYDFFLAGNGPLKNTLKNLAKNNKNIHFVDRVKQPLDFISKMDIMVVPSIREPLGNIIIESGYCKKTVIATNVDGIPEIIENGVSGILINPDKKLSFVNLPKNSVPIHKLQPPKEIDPKKLSKYIVKLEKNSSLRKKYGEKLYKTVSKKFNIENYSKKLEVIYKNIC
jgi:glycosyltransferase involved in cell wall biosynthesis